MPYADSSGCRIHYELHGAGDPLLLLSGLGGVGRAWGSLIERFSERFLTIVPDHRGTGESDAPAAGYTIAQHAADMAAVLAEVAAGSAHVVGSSTGGAIAQQMALDHRDLTRSIVLADSWAGPDDFFRHQFATRKRILLEGGPELYTETSALLLFSARHFRDHYEDITAWMGRTRGTKPEIMSERIDMIVSFDLRDRLGDIEVPTLVLVGRDDTCTPPYFSEELARLIPDAQLEVLDAGHLIYKEAPDAVYEAVMGFLASH